MNQPQQQNSEELKAKELKKLQHLQENAKPLWLTTQFVDRPCIVIAVCSVFFFIATIVSITEELFAQSPSEDREWLTWNESKVQDFDMLNEAQEIYKKKSEDIDVPVRSEEIDDWTLYLMLECFEDCNNVLNAHSLNLLHETEQKVLALDEFKDYCLATTDSSDCSPDSLQSFTKTFSDSQLANGIDDTELQAQLDWVLQEDNWDSYAHLFGKEFNKDNKKTKYLVTYIKFGAPLQIGNKRYEDQYDNFDKQEELVTKFQEKILKIQESQTKKGKGGVSLLIYSGALADTLMDGVINKDFMWAMASILFVWIYLTFHLKSLFLSSFAIFNIIMSFPLSIFIFKLIFQVSYFSTLHILVVFIVLGIAADDVFVFVDAWDQTKHYSDILDTQNKRMAVTFRRASKAMLATSSTTSIAFLATGFSTIMPISSFGIFAGILIPMNFILVITFYPPILIIQEKYFKDKCCTCMRKNNNNAQKLKTEGSEQNYQEKNKEQQSPQQQQEKEKIEPSKVEVFFANTFNTFIFKAKYFILAAFLVWFSVSIWLTTKMGPQTKPDQWLPDDYEMQRFTNAITQGMHTSGQSANVIEVSLAWGLKKMNTDGQGAWDPKDVGKLVWDTSFDLEPVANQQYLYDFCVDLRDNQSVVLNNQVDCFMIGFKDWLDAKNEDFPVKTNFMSTLEEFLDDSSEQGGLMFKLMNHVGIFENKINYILVTAASIGNPESSYMDKEKIEAKWEKIESNSNKNAPQGLNKMVEIAGEWAWMVSEKAFVTNAIQGMLISTAFALVVLLISTQNIVISLYSILSIIGIVTSVVSIMVFSGWELGVAESITIVILIGFSVDYVVHLANHYVESTYDDRYTRMKESLQEIGVSILSGSITTLGSGIFLFFAVVSIFNKFALLIVGTIIFSLLYSLFFFASLVHAFGPQGDFGDIGKYFRKKNQKVNSVQQDTNEKKQDIEIQKQVSAEAENQNQNQDVEQNNS